jgi:PAS domain S-box-containing protein
MLRADAQIVLFWGPQYAALYNDAYAPTIGDKHPAALGRPAAESWAELWDDLEPLLRGVRETGKTFSAKDRPFYIERHGGLGETVYFDVSYSAVSEHDGAVGGVLCIVSETTERVLAERILAESETRFRNMADSTPVMMWVTDPSGYCTYLNSRWYAFTGQPPGAGEGFGWLDAVHPADRPLAEAAFVAANAERQDYRVDFRLRRADGVYRWTIDAAAARFGSDGAFLGYVGSVIDIDERREAEDALRASEARFRLMADAVPAIVWVTDADGAVEFFNRQWFDYTGAEAGPTTARLVSRDFVHPDDDERTLQAFEEARRTGSTYLVEHRIRGRDGDYRWFLVRGEPDRDPHSGHITRWFGASVDIHDRKLAEARLRELNETLEARVAEALAGRKVLADVVEGTDAFIQVADQDFRWLAVNRAAADEFERIYGARPKVGDSMLDLLADRPEHQAAVKTVWSRALAGEAFTETAEFGDPGRDRRFYEMRYDVLRGPGGEPVGAYQFAYDVTQRLSQERAAAAAEAARRDADALYRAYFENTAEALFVMAVLEDGGFAIEDLNPAHQASLGFRLEEVRGKRLDQILPPDLAEHVSSYYRRVITSGEVFQYRETFELNGVSTYWDTVLVPVRDGDGRVRKLIGSSRDLTRQLVAEEQLRQSQKMEAMGQLTGGVAHDFNNLLTPILGALDMLQRQRLGGEREQRLIGGALQSAERARTLVQRLLAFARRQPLQPSAVDLRDLTRGMAELVSSTTGPQIRVVVDAPDGLPPAWADTHQLEMAILNLAVNARDAMPDGGTLRISVSEETVGRQHRSGLGPGRYLCVSVADTGHGMDAATLARAVEPFFSTKGVGKGTGLGLSMAHGLASQLGGALTIRSTPGVGTNVELWLPRGRPGSDAVEQAAVAPSPDVRSGSILLVDDEDVVRISTADMLIELGYSVVEAASAEEALRLLDRGLSPDIVVTDHLMPGMSGTELAKRLKAERPAIKVLVVSGYAEGVGITPDLPRLTKPFRSSELAASLASLG